MASKNGIIDYSKIADIYDYADFRIVKTIDLLLNKLIQKQKHLFVLDLGCGTGNYILTNHCFSNNVVFIGVDNSIEMIYRAINKNPDVLFIKSNVCKGLPFKDQCFDYITCRFAFHHFQNKKRALSEIKRVLKKRGIFYMYNIEPSTNKSWWVYMLFPEIISEDKKRFWTPKQLKENLKSINFKITIKIKKGIEVMSKKKLLERLKTRDTSQLHMVSDNIFYKRLKEVENWPDDKSLRCDYAFIETIARFK